MRLHDFECKDCGQVFEELVSGDEETAECPECASPNTKRRLSGFHAYTGGSGSTPASSGGSSGGFN